MVESRKKERMIPQLCILPPRQMCPPLLLPKSSLPSLIRHDIGEGRGGGGPPSRFPFPPLRSHERSRSGRSGGGGGGLSRRSKRTLLPPLFRERERYGHGSQGTHSPSIRRP